MYRKLAVCLDESTSEIHYALQVNILLQAYISKEEMHSFSLISDMGYVAQNAARIIRAMFEIALQNNWPVLAARMLMLCKCVDKR